jgi:hypothetical protein
MSIRAPFLACLVGALLAVAPAHGQVRKAERVDPKKQLLGTWEQTTVPPQFRQLKTFTDTHFIWVVYLKADGTVIAVGGGTYTFDGKECTEKYDYGSGPIKEFVTKPPPKFAIKFSGDGYTQEGKAPSGAMVHETYRRAK